MAGRAKCLLLKPFVKLKLLNFMNDHSFIHLNKTRTISSFLKRSHTCGELREHDVGKSVVLCGWLQYKRLNQFMILRDWQGITQVLIPSEMQQELQSFISGLPLESVLRIEGIVEARPDDQKNKKMPTGDIEVKVTEFQLLNSCQAKLPFQLKKFHEVNESLRMEYRYLDIRTEKMQHNLRLRSKMVMKMREFLCNENGFVDVETPTLFRRTPGGAREFVVPTHHPGKFYSLPQSPQQFKQLLMVGGIDRYFQIAKCYRDEGAKPDRQPEFTQVDIEMSFVDMEGVMSLTEQLLAASWPESKAKFNLPFPRLSFNETMALYGTDKPDTRFGFHLKDISASLQNSGIHFIDKILSLPDGSVQAVVVEQATKYFTKKDLTSLQEFVQSESKISTALTVIKIGENAQWQSPISNYLQPKLKEDLCSQLNIKPLDLILLVGGPGYEPHVLLGKLRLLCANILESKGVNLRDPNEFNFLWILNFPLFLPSEDGKGLEAAHHPFTAPMSEDAELLYTQPQEVKGQHYDLVLNGNEIGGGSIRIHSAKEQKFVLEKILKEDSSQLQHLLTALDSGCPPHGGIALGLDRLLAIICHEPSIRDVIAFPKSHDGKDPMSKAPATISIEDQNYYHIQTKPSK